MSEQNSRPVIFEHYPELAEKTAWIGLGSLPTPVQCLTRLGYDNLWIKRDDLTSPIYGGNKIRKLEFVLGDVERQEKRRVVTLGGIGTNHGLATAIFCDRLNIDCTVVVFRQPLTRNVKQNLLLLHKYNAEVVYRKTLWNTVISYFLTQRLRHPLDYYLFAGGSNILGTIGYVNAAFELKSQIETGLMPEPAFIFCPVGSSGTMAGLALGILLAGLKTRVVGVRVAESHLGPFQACTDATVRKLMERTYSYLKENCDKLPKVDIPNPALLSEYFGEGYGHPTSEGGDAYRLLKSRENIALDPCYSSKAFAAVLDHCRHDSGNSGTVLFWNTYNSVDLADQAALVDRDKLPIEIQRLLAEDEIEYQTSTEPPPEQYGGIMKNRFAEGTISPNFSFDSPWRKSLRFYDFVNKGKAILIFLRYIGCPLCQLKISEIVREWSSFEDKDVRVLVALQSEPESIKKLNDEKDIPFTVVCDPLEEIFGLYKVTPGSLFRYITPGVIKKAMQARKHGFKHGDNEGSELQLPAVFIVDTDKKIKYAYYGKNVADVPGNKVLLDLV